ncbi:GRIP1-associated protein 1 [Acipenser ruthenus]|uniref:GRIP1-associated protein 1 n=1 Tax=Acipenser ruthenus TaxID=7906 RepID=A0A444UF12_ACIRT|nr:GRIP1-associated protein 1 [Acipenser ruthenus]
MAQALSEEEFHRMQAQLLELRTQNYQLSDDLRKNTAGKTTLSPPEPFSSPFELAQEVDALLCENEMLLGKLHSQEEDFRLQNSTLMQELSKLCSQIEELEQENQQLRVGQGAGPVAVSPASSPVDGELLRLQAENSALQKNMDALQERYERDVQARRGAEVNGLRVSHTDHPDGQTHAEGVQGQTDNQEEGEIPEQIELKSAKLEQSLKKLSEIELQLQTEREEKRLLKEQLQSLELSEKLKKKQESFLRLQTEKETLYTDSRTKIDEIQQKKEEELKSVNIRNQKLQADLQATNQVPVPPAPNQSGTSSTSTQPIRYQFHQHPTNQIISELKEQLQTKQRDHEMALQSLKEQVACQSAESQEQAESILTENDALRTNLAALEQIQTTKTQEMSLLRDQNMALTVELQQHREEQENYLAQKDDLHSQIQEATRASGRLLEQLTELGQEKEKVQQELEEMCKTADKRKAMLDEMAIGTAQEKSRHKEEMSDVRLQHEKEVLSIRAKYERELRGLHEEKHRTEEEIRAQLREERARSRELEGLQQTVEELKLQIQSMEGTKGWFERRLQEAEVACQSAESQEQAESILTENDALRTNLAALEQIQTTKTQEMSLLRDQNMALTVELQQHREEQENYLAQKDDLHSQIQEATRASGRLLEQLTELGQEKEKVQQELEEMCKTADKRKAMLDEMAIGTAQEKSRHKEEMSDVRLQHEKEVLSIRAKYERELRGLHEEKHRTEEEIRAQLREERARSRELEGLQQTVEELKLQIQSMEGTKGWFERRLQEAEARSRELEGLQQTVEELKLQIQSMEGTKGWFERRLQEAEETIEKNLLQKQEEIRNLHEVYTAQLLVKDGEIERAKQQMGEVEKERDDQVTTISNLKQEIKDTVDGQRILEKKGSSALKDLKRQLHLERKRADKLQERLQEILTNTKARTDFLSHFLLLRNSLRLKFEYSIVMRVLKPPTKDVTTRVHKQQRD